MHRPWFWACPVAGPCCYSCALRPLLSCQITLMAVCTSFLVFPSQEHQCRRRVPGLNSSIPAQFLLATLAAQWYFISPMRVDSRCSHCQQVVARCRHSRPLPPSLAPATSNARGVSQTSDQPPRHGLRTGGRRPRVRLGALPGCLRRGMRRPPPGSRCPRPPAPVGRQRCCRRCRCRTRRCIISSSNSIIIISRSRLFALAIRERRWWQQWRPATSRRLGERMGDEGDRRARAPAGGAALGRAAGQRSRRGNQHRPPARWAPGARVFRPGRRGEQGAQGRVLLRGRRSRGHPLVLECEWQATCTTKPVVA